MKVTVCELSDDQAALASEWPGLVAHVEAKGSDVVLLPEMPFHPWWMSEPTVDPAIWAAAVASHQDGRHRVSDLPTACVLGTFPVERSGERINQAFVGRGNNHIPAHEKHFLPNEPGFWEATWCSRGNGDFSVTNVGAFSVGFLVCTELWSFESARGYGKAGAHLIASPRATLLSTRDKWLVAGRAAAIVSGTFSLSSNRRGLSPTGIEFGGQGWVIDPDGQILGLTSPSEPYVTVDIDLDQAVQAKHTYPRDVSFWSAAR